MNIEKPGSPMQVGEEAAPWKIYMSWASALFVILVLMLGVAPGRGAGWVVDDGLFLSNAWNAANGFGLDRMLPQEPVYLVNALLIKLGLIEYLHFRYVYYILGFIGSAVFFLGLDRRRFRSPLVPIAICASLLVAFSSVLLFYVFFLFGAGCYFFAIDASQRKRQVLLAVSGLLFAVTGFMHAAFAIAMSILVGVALLIDHSMRKSWLWPCFILGSLSLWGGYIYWLGIDHLLATPAGHDASASHLLLNVGRILWTYLTALLAYLLAVMLFRNKGIKKFAAAQFLLSVLATIFYGAQFYGAQFAGLYSDWFAPWLGAHASGVLQHALRLVVHVPGAIYYLLLFAIFRWLGEGWAESNMVRFPADKANSFSTNGVENGLSRLQQTASKLFSFLRSSCFNHKLTIAIAGLFLLVSGYAAGSASNIAICMSAYSGPAIGLVIVLWARLDQKFTRPATIMLTVWLGIFALFALTINLPTFEPIFSRDRIALGDTPLKGILVQPRYASSVARLREVYRANGCQGLPLIALEYVPTVYYLLQHSVPNSIGIVRPGVYFPEGRIRGLLDNQQGWCVLDATTQDTKTEISRNLGMDKRNAIRNWVVSNADRAFEIPSPSDDIGDIQLLIRDAR